MTKEKIIKIIAGTIANTRIGRYGMPPISNVLDFLSKSLQEEVINEAEQVCEELIKQKVI